MVRGCGKASGRRGIRNRRIEVKVFVCPCTVCVSRHLLSFGCSALSNALCLRRNPATPTMPTKWTADIFDYDTNTMKHKDVDSLDDEPGEWFKCKHCQNPKASEGKFHCRTAFNGEQFTGPKGHMMNKQHQEKTAAVVGAGPPSNNVVASLFKAAGGATRATDNKKQAVANPQRSEVDKSGPLPCDGLGCETTESTTDWAQIYVTYLTSRRASKKHRVEKIGGRYLAKSVDCHCVGLKGSQHGVKCCKPCHNARCDEDQIAKKAVLSADKLTHAEVLMAQATLSKSDSVAPLDYECMETTLLPIQNHINSDDNKKMVHQKQGSQSRSNCRKDKSRSPLHSLLPWAIPTHTRIKHTRCGLLTTNRRVLHMRTFWVRLIMFCQKPESNNLRYG